jgi:DNA-binding transcriptional LysR family regulator
MRYLVSIVQNLKRSLSLDWDWDHLRVFLAVVRQGQLLAAARKLNLNHATVARRLDSLEKLAGVVLFDRRPSGTSLTDAGALLLPFAEKMETEAVRAASVLQQREAEVSGTVRIGAPDALGNVVLAHELGKLTTQHPGLIVELVPLPRTFSLSRREADIAIGLDHPNIGRQIVTKLCDYSLGVYASRAYLDRAGQPNCLKDLELHTLVAGVDDFTYATALEYSAEFIGRSARVFRCASVAGQMEAISAGTGIGILHDFVAHGRAQLVRILPEVSYQRSYWMLTHPDTHDMLRIATVRNFLVRLLRKRRAEFRRFDSAIALPP